MLELVPVCSGADGYGRRDSADDAGGVEVVVAVAVGVVGDEDVSGVGAVRIAVAAVVGSIDGAVLLELRGRRCTSDVGDDGFGAIKVERMGMG